MAGGPETRKGKAKLYPEQFKSVTCVSSTFQTHNTTVVDPGFPTGGLRPRWDYVSEKNVCQNERI